MKFNAAHEECRLLRRQGCKPLTGRKPWCIGVKPVFESNMTEERTDKDVCPSLHATPQPLPGSRVGDALPGQASAPAVALSHPKSSLAFRRGSCLLEGAR